VGASGLMKPATLGWIYLGEEEARRGRDFIKSLASPETLDELGLGRMRGVIANRLFPATVVGMTRARYLIFVPAILRHLESGLGRRPSRPRDLRQRANTWQDYLRAALDTKRQRNKQVGVIGRVARGSLERFPSSIYWDSLRQLGVLQFDGLEHEYYRVLAASGSDAYGRDDDGEVLDQLLKSKEDWWDPECPGIEKASEWLSASSLKRPLSFRLTRPEARYLRQKFGGDPSRPTGQPTLDGSLTAFLLQKTLPGSARYEQEDLWSGVPVPHALRECVEEARLFSLVAHGLTVHYHALMERRQEALARHRRTARSGEAENAFEEWWNETRPEVARSKPSGGFTVVLNECDSRDWTPDIGFLEAWLASVRCSSSAKGFLGAVSTAKEIEGREAACRGKRARLRNADEIRRWEREVPAGPYHFDYRWPIARNLVNDILQLDPAS